MPTHFGEVINGHTISFLKYPSFPMINVIALRLNFRAAECAVSIQITSISTRRITGAGAPSGINVQC